MTFSPALTLPTSPQTYGKQVDDALIESRAPNSVSSAPIHKAVALFRHAAHFVHSSAEKLGADLPHSAAKVRVLNDRLMLTERAFLEGEGLRGRPWYKHLVRPCCWLLRFNLLGGGNNLGVSSRSDRDCITSF